MFHQYGYFPRDITTPPTGFLAHLRHRFAGRPEIGAAFWSTHPSSGTASFYNYEETIAIISLIIRGWSIDAAVSVVSAELVVAEPHVMGAASPRAVAPYYTRQLGIARLADGSMWDILGDDDVPRLDDADNIITQIGLEHSATALRNLETSADAFELRIRQLVTIGDLDADGRFVADHAYGAHVINSRRARWFARYDRWKRRLRLSMWEPLHLPLVVRAARGKGTAPTTNQVSDDHKQPYESRNR